VEKLFVDQNWFSEKLTFNKLYLGKGMFEREAGDTT
jgi:hypothetical protein